MWDAPSFSSTVHTVQKIRFRPRPPAPRPDGLRRSVPGCMSRRMQDVWQRIRRRGWVVQMRPVISPGLCQPNNGVPHLRRRWVLLHHRLAHSNVWPCRRETCDTCRVHMPLLRIQCCWKADRPFSQLQPGVDTIRSPCCWPYCCAPSRCVQRSPPGEGSHRRQPRGGQDSCARCL